MKPYLRTVTPSEDLTIDVEFVRDQHLRSPNGTVEDDYIAQLIRASQSLAERVTRRAILTQTWELVLDRFPSDACQSILIPKPPLQSVSSITYVDEDGAEQTWGGSPLPYVVTTPGGPTADYAYVQPAYGESWPTARLQTDAVVIRFVCGYADADSVPADIVQGQLLVIGEMYKQRSESVHAFNQNPALIRARDLWLNYRVFRG